MTKKASGMHIQYVGFNVGAGFRAYAFRVIDTPEVTREFTVEVCSDAFRQHSLKFQDGPDICFARLRRELEVETPESRAAPQLIIGEQDIKDYLEQHYPRKRSSYG